MPTGLVLPYSARSVRPATMVGSANGRSMSALTSALPRNSSRTRTQAMSTPITASIAATTTDTPIENFIAATAWRLVIASQNSPLPPSNERATTAASGMRTIRVSQATERPPTASGPVRTRRCPAVRRGVGLARGAPARLAGAPSVAISLGRADTEILLDLRHRALVRVEELVVDLAPATELVDREQLFRPGVPLLVDQPREDR